MKKAEYYDYNALKSLIEGIPVAREKAIFGMLYGFGLRVGELLQLTKKSLAEKIISGTKFYILTVPTEKNPHIPYRNLPLPILPEKDGWLMEIVASLEALHKNSPDNQRMFPHHRVTVYKWCRKWLGFHPHWLRHLRLTHLANEGKGEYYLSKYAGWTSGQPAKTYVKISYMDLLPIPHTSEDALSTDA